MFIIPISPSAEDIIIMTQAIKSKNWAYVNNWLPRWTHSDQFLFLDALPIEVLEELHIFVFEHNIHLQSLLAGSNYITNCCVTLLRSKGAYKDIRRDDGSITDKKIEIQKAIADAGLIQKRRGK